MLLPEPGAAMLAGVNAAVTPLGNPVTVKAMAALKVELGVVVSVTVLEAPPAVTLREVAPEARANVGVAATVTESDTCCLMAPLAAETVTG